MLRQVRTLQTRDQLLERTKTTLDDWYWGYNQVQKETILSTQGVENMLQSGEVYAEKCANWRGGPTKYGWAFRKENVHRYIARQKRSCYRCGEKAHEQMGDCWVCVPCKAQLKALIEPVLVIPADVRIAIANELGYK